MSNDLTGKIFGDLEVIRKVGVTKSKKNAWECKCLLCNSITTVVTGHLKSGHTTSCGCKIIKHNHSHGKHRLYSIWTDMHRRCENENNKDYKYYGAKGITVCKEWNDYLVFMNWSFQNDYEDSLTIDRIDNYKGYSPDNCRWVTRAFNNKNKRKKQDRDY